MSVEMIITVILFAFVCELIDTSLGMGYGTILSPLLLCFGFDPLVLVPAILITQAMGGATASVFHHKFHNATFTMKSPDSKVVMIVAGCGILATIGAVAIAFSIPKIALKIYISSMVLVMGLLILFGVRLSFSWGKMMFIGVLSAFNKALTGGGYGPVVTGSQIICGKEEKSSIGCTDFAEVPICLASFLAYVVVTTATKQHLDWTLVACLGIGAVVSAPIGAFITKVIPTKPLKLIIGLLITGEGIWSFIKTFC
jgi:uncharacterized membrane protein YfcA